MSGRKSRTRKVGRAKSDESRNFFGFSFLRIPSRCLENPSRSATIKNTDRCDIVLSRSVHHPWWRRTRQKVSSATLQYFRYSFKFRIKSYPTVNDTVVIQQWLSAQPKPSLIHYQLIIIHHPSSIDHHPSWSLLSVPLFAQSLLSHPQIIGDHLKVAAALVMGYVNILPS